MSMNWKLVGQAVGGFLKRRSPEILTGLGVAGMGLSIIFAVRATPKAVKVIEKMKPEEKKTTTIIKKTWKYYAPAAISFAASSACIIFAAHTNYRQKAALAAAYSVTETALRDYKEAAKEVTGERTEAKISETAADKAAERHEYQENRTYILTGTQTTVYDPWSGRDFPYDIDELKHAIEDISYQLREEEFITLNEFYDRVGWDRTAAGNVLGWNAAKGPIRAAFSSTIVNDRPVLVLGFSRDPIENYAE